MTPSNSKNELLDSPGKRENPDRPPLVSPSNSISAAKLLNGVEKSYDSGKKLLDESKDLTDGEVYFRNNNDGKTRELGDLPKAEYQEATDGRVHFRTTPSTAIDSYHRVLNAY